MDVRGEDNARERVDAMETPAEDSTEESSEPETSPTTSAISLGEDSDKN